MMRQFGTKLICVDPRITGWARAAEIVLQVHPGTDTALAMAWIYVMDKEDLVDHDFIDTWTYGYDELVERVPGHAAFARPPRSAVSPRTTSGRPPGCTAPRKPCGARLGPRSRREPERYPARPVPHRAHDHHRLHRRPWRHDARHGRRPAATSCTTAARIDSAREGRGRNRLHAHAGAQERHHDRRRRGTPSASAWTSTRRSAPSCGRRIPTSS